MVESIYSDVCFPIYPDELCNIHSGLVYNLQAFRRHRDGFGRAEDGAWGLSEGKRFWGGDVWLGRVIPPRGTDDGCWHGAVDLVPRAGEQLPVCSVAAGEVVRRSVKSSGNYSAVLVRHEVDGLWFYAIYQHLSSRGLPAVGRELAPGDSIGRLAPLGGGVHLHFELHAAVDLWDYARLDAVTTRGFYIEYTEQNKLRSQFSSRFLPDDLATHFCYNGWAWLAHRMGMELPNLKISSLAIA
jgi:murein DD-endopeptidase MepM/ murein hydrolase activator NlpD